MRDIPECLSRRFKALDDLIEELKSYQPSNPHAESASTDDPGIKLMCDFWSILKEDPDVDLTQAIQKRMRVDGVRNGMFGSKHITCFRAGCCDNDDKKQEALRKIKKISSENPGKKSQCGSSKSTTSSTMSQNNIPLNKVLCNLKEAASFEKKCHGKVKQLQDRQKELQEQIQQLEQRERDGVELLKQADCMWSCMEEAYKNKISESLERQNGLLEQLKEAESSNLKWRKSKKDLEFQMNNINKCYQEIQEKINEKTSDIKCRNMEIENFKKRIESNKTDLEAVKKSFGSKKQTSDVTMKKIADQVKKLEKRIDEEKKHKLAKEREGSKYIKEAREELQILCKVLLQKKLENEDLQAEKEALLLEIELLVQNCDQCKDKCRNKQESVEEEIKAIDKEIAEFKVRCTQCHKCVDTADNRKFCTDCSKCLEERNCLDEGDHCNVDHTMDCVCMTVKQKFLDNVFDNMYTSLERQVKTGHGKAVADEVLKCLKKSRNGKLNNGTRKILQDFILSTVEKNLNLTIVGGAVKTRCEMDAETYKQLMLCLKEVKIAKPPKVDKGTEAKKEPCKRWGGTSECNCPKVLDACICVEKAPLPVTEPSPPPSELADKDDPGEVIVCPQKDSTLCGPDCTMYGILNAVGTEVAAWRPSPCQGPTCQFSNMRAAQCVLGPEILISSRDPDAQSSFSPATSILDDQIACRCSGVPQISCVCHKDLRCQPREHIIEEVMGRYTEVAPIEKVSYTMISSGSLNIKH
ncbi:myosin heavy chain, clone 203-like [Maniola hyperantus]|uniref:myosin heavy chain, clone 203-like n=1 Tax=Aphantopus hyperantus TaxID=2795564 RepID=UPI00213AB584